MSTTETRLPTETGIARAIERLLVERLPSGWSLRIESNRRAGQYQVDCLLEITSPRGETALLAVEIKRTAEPRLVTAAAEQVQMIAAETKPPGVPVVAAAYLSPRSRMMLEDLGVGYVDTTGNTRIEVAEPGLFISADGADRDPWPQSDALQSLRGRGAARAIRAIIDTRPPFGVRELAAATGASAPTISRVLEVLSREGLVTREPRGPVVAVDWQGVIRRWAEDYDLTTTNRATTYLEPRGAPAMERKLIDSDLTYAATGALAAQHFDPVAPAMNAIVYVEDAAVAAEELHLRESDAVNVILLEPYDPVVFDRTIVREGLRCVAPTQLAVDLLTGIGRDPAGGEELLRWMEDNQSVWRS